MTPHEHAQARAARPLSRSWLRGSGVAAAMRRWPTRQWASMQLAAAVSACAIVLAWTLPREVAVAFASESGPLETFQALLLAAIAAGIWLLRRPGEDRMTALALSMWFTAMAARELEWHRAWTSGSVLKLSFYMGPAAAAEKLAGAAVLLVLALAGGYLAKRYARSMLRALRTREPSAITIAMFFVSVAATRVVDKSLKLADEWFGWSAGASAFAAKHVVEEVLELLFPLLALLGALQLRAAKRERARTQSV
jgi:hypothetical protein